MFYICWHIVKSTRTCEYVLWLGFVKSIWFSLGLVWRTTSFSWTRRSLNTDSCQNCNNHNSFEWNVLFGVLQSTTMSMVFVHQNTCATATINLSICIKLQSIIVCSSMNLHLCFSWRKTEEEKNQQFSTYFDASCLLFGVFFCHPFATCVCVCAHFLFIVHGMTLSRWNEIQTKQIRAGSVLSIAKNTKPLSKNFHRKCRFSGEIETVLRKWMFVGVFG